MKSISVSLLGLLVAAQALAGNYIGDYAPGDTVDCNFGTVQPSTGASYALAGTPAVSIYKDNSTTESTSGVTLTASLDSRTGLNHVRVTTASDGSFYSAGSHFEAVLTAGTVDSVSVVGQPVCSFSLGKTQAKATAGGITEASFATTAGSFRPLGIARQGTAQSASGTTLVMDSSASFADDTAIGMTVVACGSTQGYCQARAVTDNVGSTDTLTVDAWTVTPSGTITYYLIGTAPFSGGGGGGLDAAGVRAAVGLASANLDTQLSGIQSDTDNIQTRIPASLVSGRMDSSVGAMASGTLTATAIASDAITAAKVASDVGTEIGTATWGVGSRTLSAGTNIVLAKGTGVTGFNDLDAAGIRSALGMSSANLDTQLSTISTAVVTTIPAAVAVIDGIVDELKVGVNIEKMNGADVCGDGKSGTPWTGCP